MHFYPGQIREYFLHPRNVGEVPDAEAVGDSLSLRCGAVLRLTMKVDSESRVITGALFRATGCGYLIAAASLLTELVQGLGIGEAGRLSDGPLMENALAERLDAPPPERRHCFALCGEALASAVGHYRTTTLEEWTGEEALICTCFGVSEKSIERAIRSQSLKTLREVTRACNAGAGCRSCHPLIEDILFCLNREP